MPAHQIEYEVLRAGPNLEEIKKALNEVGRRGFQLHDTQANESGVYTFIFSKNTGITAEEPGEVAGGEWIDDGFVNEETAWT
jgi:hypothetical protein